MVAFTYYLRCSCVALCLVVCMYVLVWLARDSLCFACSSLRVVLFRDVLGLSRVFSYCFVCVCLLLLFHYPFCILCLRLVVSFFGGEGLLLCVVCLFVIVLCARCFFLSCCMFVIMFVMCCSCSFGVVFGCYVLFVVGCVRFSLHRSAYV